MSLDLLIGQSRKRVSESDDTDETEETGSGKCLILVGKSTKMVNDVQCKAIF